MVTRTNSKRWRYWASVQGYAPSVLALSETFYSVLSFFQLLQSCIFSFFFPSVIFLPCLLYVWFFLFILTTVCFAFTTLSLVPSFAQWKRKHCKRFHASDTFEFAWLPVVIIQIIAMSRRWWSNSDVGSIYIGLLTDVIDRIEDLLVNRVVIARVSWHTCLGIFFRQSKSPLYFLQWNHPASSIFDEQTRFGNIFFQIYSFELVAGRTNNSNSLSPSKSQKLSSSHRNCINQALNNGT